MPDWLPGVLVQFPIVLLMGLLGHYAYNQLKDERGLRRNAEAGRRPQRSEEGRPGAKSRPALGEKEERHRELRQLTDGMSAELKRLADAIETLARKRS